MPTADTSGGLIASKQKLDRKEMQDAFVVTAKSVQQHDAAIVVTQNAHDARI